MGATGGSWAQEASPSEGPVSRVRIGDTPCRFALIGSSRLQGLLPSDFPSI